MKPDEFAANLAQPTENYTAEKVGSRTENFTRCTTFPYKSSKEIYFFSVYENGNYISLDRCVNL